MANLRTLKPHEGHTTLPFSRDLIIIYWCVLYAMSIEELLNRRYHTIAIEQKKEHPYIRYFKTQQQFNTLLLILVYTHSNGTTCQLLKHDVVLFGEHESGHESMPANHTDWWLRSETANIHFVTRVYKCIAQYVVHTINDTTLPQILTPSHTLPIRTEKAYADIFLVLKHGRLTRTKNRLHSYS